MYSSPAFDASGTLLAAYDSADDQVRIFRSADLTPVDSLKPTHLPRRLSFSPTGQFLLIEAHQGWVDRYLKTGPLPGGMDITSSEATRDDIQRVEVWNLRTRQAIPNLSCDAVATTEPKGGWLWAKGKAITPGYRSSAILGAHFSPDEKTLSMLCWNGIRQRWESESWKRIEDLPQPPFWDAMMGVTTPQWLTGDGASTRSEDGRIAILRVRQKSFGFSTTYIWDQETSLAHQLPGDCATRLQPIYALSRDGKRIVTVCNQGMGHAIRAWDLGLAQEITLHDAEFGFVEGPVIRGEGVALSPDGQYLAVALLNLNEGLVVTPLPTVGAIVSRSDLRLWHLEGGKELVAVSLDEQAVRANYFRGVDLAFSPDSRMLAVGGRQIRLYRVSDLAGPPH
jgi:WD40 repeat protein